jgi:TonB family protein
MRKFFMSVGLMLTLVSTSMASTGGVDKEVIRMRIRDRLPNIKSCYNRSLKARSSLKGRVVVKWEIEKSGRVRHAKVSQSSLHNAKVEKCVVGVIEELQFPKPKGGRVASITYPFVFATE